MSEITVIARLRVMATDLQLKAYRDEVVSLEPNKRGLLGASTWRSLEPDGGVMTIMRYVDSAVAEEALEALVSSNAGPMVASLSIDPPDVILMAPKSNKGKTFEEIPVGSLLSLAVRVSDPGQQEELELDTDEVLSELSYIPGYLGSYWGNNVTLNEEILSLVTWANMDALESSIPTSHKVKIQRWQKAF